MYNEGKGVPQDYTEAVNWYRKAAEQGFASAQYRLGNMYKDGQGVIQDIVYAHMWSNIAAANGNQDGVTNRDILAKRMTASQFEKAQELARECAQKNNKGC